MKKDYTCFQETDVLNQNKCLAETATEAAKQCTTSYFVSAVDKHFECVENKMKNDYTCFQESSDDNKNECLVRRVLESGKQCVDYNSASSNETKWGPYMKWP